VEKIGVVDIDIEELKSIDPELAQSVYAIYEELQDARRELLNAKKSETVAWNEREKLEIELERLRERNEFLEAHDSKLQKQLIKAQARIKHLESQIQEADLRMTMWESSFLELMGGLENLYSLVAEKYTESIPEAVREELKKDIQFIVEQVTRFVPAPAPAPAPTEKGE